MAEGAKKPIKIEYFKLGEFASNFFDASQPKNKKLMPGQVMIMQRTPKLLKTLKGGGLEVAEKEEYTKYIASLKGDKKPAEAPKAEGKPEDKK